MGSNITFFANGNNPQAEMLLRLASNVQETYPGSYFVVVTDDMSSGYVQALRDLKTTVLILSDSQRQNIASEFSSEAHALGKSAKPAFFRTALDHFKEVTDYVVYLDPDIVIQGNIDKILTLAGDDRVVMAEEVTPANENPGTIKKLERAIASGILTTEQCTNFTAEVNTGFQLGRRGAIIRYLDRFLNYMNSAPAQCMYKNTEGRMDSWHDQDFFRAFLRSDENIDWLALGDFSSIATLCGDGFNNVRIIAPAPPTVTLHKDGTAPPIVHFAGGAWQRSSAARGYFELAPVISEIRRPDQIDLLKLESDAAHLAAAEESATNWRNAYEKILKEHRKLLEKWNELTKK
jgi:hypothetical protein